jgi:sugar O-acyltransferase (sialic acid O-acetyltransferase NeuD family)
MDWIALLGSGLATHRLKSGVCHRISKEIRSMEKVIIYGNKSMAREFFFCLKYYSDYAVEGFTVDRECLESDTLLGLPIIPFDRVETEFPPAEYKMLIAVGYVQNNKIRKDRYYRSKEMGYQLINFISPSAILHPETTLGDNSFIGHYSVVSPDATVGNNVIIGNSCTIGHDVHVADHCFLSPCVSVSGSVEIGSCSFLGTSATIRNKVSIGKECVIGAGAVILESTKDGSVYLGEPATLLPISSHDLPLA